MNIDMKQFSTIKDPEKVSEDRYTRDRDMYLRGRAGYPEQPTQPLSERDSGCYMMGYNLSELENSYV